MNRRIIITSALLMFFYQLNAQEFLKEENQKWVNHATYELTESKEKILNALFYLSKSPLLQGCSNLSSAKQSLYYYNCSLDLKSNRNGKVKFDIGIDVKDKLEISYSNIQTNAIGGTYKAMEEITSDKKYSEKEKYQETFKDSDVTISVFNKLLIALYEAELKTNRPPTLKVLDKEFERNSLFDNQLTLQHIFDVDGSKEILYRQLKTWVSLNYRSADAVIQYDNETEGKLIVKGFFSNVTKGGIFNFNYNWHHTLILEAKENKIRLTMTNVQMQYDDSSIGDRRSIDWWLTKGTNMHRRAVNENMEKSKRMFVEIINDINKNLNTDSVDDW